MSLTVAVDGSTGKLYCQGCDGELDEEYRVLLSAGGGSTDDGDFSGSEDESSSEDEDTTAEPVPSILQQTHDDSARSVSDDDTDGIPPSPTSTAPPPPTSTAPPPPEMIRKADTRNQAVLKALPAGGETSFIQTKDGLVLIGDGHDWSAMHHADRVGYDSGRLRIRKGDLASAGKLYVTTAGDYGAFQAAIARVSDKKCVFQ